MLTIATLLFAQAAAAQAAGRTAPSPLAPSEIVAAAPAADWVTIAPSDLLVMELAPQGAKPRRVIIQLIPPPFSQGWVGNIRKLTAARFWDGTSVNRVQDNYVVQWGDASEKKPLPPGLAKVAEERYLVDQIDLQIAKTGEERSPELVASYRNAMDPKVLKRPRRKDAQFPVDMLSTRTKNAPDGWHQRDSYAPYVELYEGWPVGSQGDGADAQFWPLHCYAMVGVGRNLAPDTGTGAELYTVIGHAPRHLDRNIALVGRVIEGIEHLSSLPRGSEALGFYKTAAERAPIVSVRLGNEVPALPPYQYLSTESASFAAYAEARANRRDAFFNVPAGGADICNIPVPVRRVD